MFGNLGLLLARFGFIHTIGLPNEEINIILDLKPKYPYLFWRNFIPFITYFSKNTDYSVFSYLHSDSGNIGVVIIKHPVWIAELIHYEFFPESYTLGMKLS